MVLVIILNAVLALAVLVAVVGLHTSAIVTSHDHLRSRVSSRRANRRPLPRVVYRLADAGS